MIFVTKEMKVARDSCHQRRFYFKKLFIEYQERGDTQTRIRQSKAGAIEAKVHNMYLQ